MFTSVIFTLSLIFAVSVFNVCYVSFFLKEHQVPLIFRQTDSTLYYDTQRAKNFFFLIYIVLCGILAQLNFYVVKDSCLHTVDEDSLSTSDVDMYQYALLALLWVVAMPIIILIGMAGMKDNMKVGCYPVVIANVIFGLMLFILSQIVIINAMFYAENELLKYCHLINYGVLGVSLLVNIIYRLCLAKNDVVVDERSLADEA